MTGFDLLSKLIQCEPTEQELIRVSQACDQITVAEVRHKAMEIARFKGRSPVHESLIKSLARDFPNLKELK